MSKIPPLLPVEMVRRLLRVAHADGLSVLVVAGASALMAASSQDRLDAGLLLLVCGAGAMELHGANLIGGGDRKGIRWLIGSQLFLMTVMIAYVVVHFLHLPVPTFSSMMPDAVMQETATNMAMSPQAFNQQFDTAIGGTLIFLTLIYQGWMIAYYTRRRQALNTFFGTL